ncbi:MAG: chloride channel protein [Bacteroidetes bacterium]|nr:chloride channel protein [Bacteroidota bacterium]
MKRRITESTVLFISIIKWVFLATVAGGIVGAAAALFLNLLDLAANLGRQSTYTFLFIPFALFASALLVKYLAPDAEGHGTEKVIEAIHKRSGKIALPVVPVKLAATIITLATGGSAGKEGPCAQIGAGLTSFLSDIFKFDDHDRKKLVVCGISAGFAAVFGTPIAGSIFGVEVLFVGAILYEVLLPSFIAGITAYQVTSLLGVTYFHGQVNVVPVFTELFLLKVMLAGLFFGICSIILIETLKAGEKISNRIKIWTPFKGLIGGIFLVILALIFSKNYLGLGLQTIEGAFRGETADWYAFLLKPVFTSITLNFGGSGGIVTPIFFIGATAGLFFATVMNLNLGTFSAIGLVSVLAGSANTPIAASIMAVELFGPQIAPYATVACVISFLITGHRSVYPSQVLSISKSPSLKVEIGKELEDIQTSYIPRKKSLAGLVFRFIGFIEKLVSRIQGGRGSGDHTDNSK